MPRLSVIGCSLALPMNRRTESLRPPSRWSLTSASSVSPLHSWKAPPVSGFARGFTPFPPAALGVSETANRKARSSAGVVMSTVFQPELAARLERELQDQELQ